MTAGHRPSAINCRLWTGDRDPVDRGTCQTCEAESPLMERLAPRSAFVVFEDSSGRYLSTLQRVDVDGQRIQDVRLEIHTAGIGRLCLYDSEGRFVYEDRLWHRVHPGVIYTNTVHHWEDRGFLPPGREPATTRQQQVRAGLMALFAVLALLGLLHVSLWIIAEVPPFVRGLW